METNPYRHEESCTVNCLACKWVIQQMREHVESEIDNHLHISGLFGRCEHCYKVVSPVPEEQTQEQLRRYRESLTRRVANNRDA
jgi:hypothetical protein